MHLKLPNSSARLLTNTVSVRDPKSLYLTRLNLPPQLLLFQSQLIMVELEVFLSMSNLILPPLAQGTLLSVMVLAQIIFNYALEMVQICLVPQRTAAQGEFTIIGSFRKIRILDLSNTEVAIGQIPSLLPQIWV